MRFPILPLQASGCLNFHRDLDVVAVFAVVAVVTVAVFAVVVFAVVVVAAVVAAVALIVVQKMLLCC